MNEQVKAIYKEMNDVWGKPQTYRGIQFHPINLVDSEYLDMMYRYFAQPKNYIQDVAVLKMSYLKFLIMLAGDKKEKFQSDIRDFFKYVTKNDDISDFRWKIIDVNKPADINNISIEIDIAGVVICEADFENIREIILQQNGLSVEYVEEYNEDLEKKLEFFSEVDDTNYIDQLFTFSLLEDRTMDEIGKYTMYQMKHLLERSFTLKHYDLYKPLVVSGQITLKSGEVKPFLYHIGQKGRYSSIKMDVKEYLDKNKDIFK
jgi:hypothetical protein